LAAATSPHAGRAAAKAGDYSSSKVTTLDNGRLLRVGNC
jgi:hypothetical protein